MPSAARRRAFCIDVRSRQPIHCRKSKTAAPAGGRFAFEMVGPRQRTINVSELVTVIGLPALITCAVSV
jgi:hypothetical protein